jgi:hypothetical protein
LLFAHCATSNRTLPEKNFSHYNNQYRAHRSVVGSGAPSMQDAIVKLLLCGDYLKMGNFPKTLFSELHSNA